MDFVLDCSVAISWCFEEEADSSSERVLDSLATKTAMVPELWHLEVANVLLHCERKGRLTEAQGAAFLRRLGQLPIRSLSISREEQFSDVLHLARRLSLTVYDAVYLHLSLREGAPLATRDGSLRIAASKSGVPLL